MQRLTSGLIASVLVMMTGSAFAQSPLGDAGASPLGAAPAQQAAPASDASLKNNPLVQTLKNALAKQEGAQAQAENPLGAASNLPLGPQTDDGTLGFVPLSPEEVQAQAEAEAEIQKQKFRDEAFTKAMQTLLPLTPDEIHKILGSFGESREAAETPMVYPKPEVHFQTISLDPGVTPPVIKTTPGHVTTLTILDMTGEPWPILDVSWAGKFQVNPPEDGGHVIRVTPMSAHGIGNLSIRLVDLITPITFSLDTGLNETHYRFDATVPKMGPLAKTPLIEHGGISTVAGDAALTSVLDGTPPGGASKLTVLGTDHQTSAWQMDGKVYLRTPLTLLSPAWDSSATSADGMNVYAMNETPVLLLSDNGRIVKAQISDGEVTQ